MAQTNFAAVPIVTADFLLTDTTSRGFLPTLHRNEKVSFRCEFGLQNIYPRYIQGEGYLSWGIEGQETISFL